MNNGLYLCGRIAGYGVPIDAPHLIYPRRISGPGPMPIEGDVHHDCQIHYFPLHEIDSGLAVKVICETVEASDVRVDAFLVPLIEEPSASTPYAIGFNRSVVARLWRHRRLADA